MGDNNTDLSHPIKGFTHWMIWNIPAVKAVPGAIPASKILPPLENAKQGVAFSPFRPDRNRRKGKRILIGLHCIRSIAHWN